MGASPVSFFTFDRYIQAVDDTLDKTVRIDRPLSAFVEGPSKKTGVDLAQALVVPLASVSASSVLGVAFGVYLFTANVLLGGLIQIFREDWKGEIQKLPDLDQYFPEDSALQKIALGLVVWFPFQFLDRALSTLILKLFCLFDFPTQGSQDVGLLVTSGGISSLVWMTYVCILGPIAEEIAFRGYFQDLLKKGEHSTASNTLLSAVKANAVFAAMHLSPFQGWYNLPVFVSAFTFGMWMSFLKRITGDLWTPAFYHITNNMIATAALRC